MYNEKFIPKEKPTYLYQLQNGYNRLYVKTCSYCGKKFDIYPRKSVEWVYKVQHNYSLKMFCGWNCQVRYEKEKGIY